MNRQERIDEATEDLYAVVNEWQELYDQVVEAATQYARLTGDTKPLDILNEGFDFEGCKP